MRHTPFARLSRTVFHAALAACLVAVAADADAKGGRRSGGSSFSKSSSKSHEDGGSSGPSFTVRTSSSSSSSSSAQAQDGSADGLVPFPAGKSGSRAADTPMTAEELARRAVLMEAYEREQAEKANAKRLAADRPDVGKPAAAKAAPVAQMTPEEKAAAAQAEKAQREAAVLAAEATQVLERAITDHPVLKTPAGQPYLQLILERQKALVASGLYPSVAMVEAVADHKYTLSARQREPLKVYTSAPAPSATPAAAAPAETGQGFGGCRWVSSVRWACE